MPASPPAPSDLPEPVDDGAADHLRGMRAPAVTLLATHGEPVRLDQLRATRAVICAYPRTGPPGQGPLAPGWDQIPGARGCTPESCGFRDHHAKPVALGAEVYGLSTQDTACPREVGTPLGLPFPQLSDSTLRLTTAWRLPARVAAGRTLLRRLTVVLPAGLVEHVWYPVLPPDRPATEAVGGLAGRAETF